jgi:hypothetical protein
MKLPGAFNHGSNVNRSSLFDCESSINLRPESGQVGTPKEDAYSQRTPGMGFLFSVGSDPIEALYTLNGRAFGISGSVFFEVTTDGLGHYSFTIWGTVAASGSTAFPLATMCSNGPQGDQVFIVSGGNGYIFTLSTNTLAIIADLDFPNGNALMGEFFAGYFFVLLLDSQQVQWSALFDGTAWDPLDVMIRSWAPDNIAFIKRLGTHIVVVGQQTSEVWYATGGVEVFAPAQESLIEHGAVSSFSGVRVEKDGTTTLIWLDQSERGGGVVVAMAGLSLQVLSTFSNAFFNQSRGHNLQHARCFAVQIDGHVDYVLNNQEVEYDRTPVYDLSMNEWSHRAHWNPNAPFPLPKWIPWRAQCAMYFDQRVFVGDALTGAVYLLSMDNLTDELAVV